MVTKYIILIFIGCDQKCSKLWNYINSLLLLFFDRCLQIPFWNIQNNKKFFLKWLNMVYICNKFRWAWGQNTGNRCMFCFSFVLWLCLLVTIVDMLSLFFVEDIGGKNLYFVWQQRASFLRLFLSVSFVY